MCTPAVSHALLFVLHGAQSITQFALSVSKTSSTQVPVLYSFPTVQPWNVTVRYESRQLFEIQILYFVASFLLLTSVSHFASAVLSCFGSLNSPYILRDFEYSVTSTIMVLAIALMSGISDIFALICIATSNVVMIMCGAYIDSTLQPFKGQYVSMSKPTGLNMLWAVFYIGCVAGIAPWIAIFTSIGLNTYIPAFVYWATFSLFVGFFGFAVHAALILHFMLRKITSGKGNETSCCCINATWYLQHEEQIYMILSLVSKSNLSWSLCAPLLL